MHNQINIGANQQSFALQAPHTQDESVIASSRLASNLSGGLRKAAVYTRGLFDVVASASALISTAAVTNHFYQQNRLSPPATEKFVVFGNDANPIDVMEYDHCITGHLQPAGIPGTPHPISNSTFPVDHHPSIPSSVYLEACVLKVGTFLTHDLANQAEHDLSGWRTTHSAQVAWWAMATSVATTTLAVALPYTLNRMAKALENRAARAQALTNPVDHSNTPQVEPAAEAVADIENALQVEPAVEAVAVRSSVASKILHRAKWIPQMLLTEGTAGLFAAAAIWVGATAKHKLNHISADSSLTTLSGIIHTEQNTLADVLPRISAYKADRLESLQFNQACQIAAWTAPAAVVAVLATSAAVKLTQCAINHRQKALTTTPVILPEAEL